MKLQYRKLSLALAAILTIETLIVNPVSTTAAETDLSIEKTVIPVVQKTMEENTTEEISTEEITTVEEPTTEPETEPTTTEETTEEPTTVSPYIASKLSPVKSKVVVLDPGHGSIHHGASANGLNEEAVVLDIAKYCRNELNRYGNVTVYLTHSTIACCNHLSLNDCLLSRNYFAKRLQADFLVSLHINYDDNSNRSGCMVLPAYKSGYHDNVRVETQALGKLALKELQKLGIKSEGFWLRKLSSDRYPNHAKSDFYSIIRNGVLLNLPSIIIEHGYVTCKTDYANHFSTKKQRKELGIADANAIASYYNLKENQFTGKFSKKGKSTYYINSEGKKITGWIKEDGNWYYMNPSNGKLMKGFVTVGKYQFYLNASTGAMESSWFTVKGKRYFSKGTGVMETNKIVSILGKKYYFNSKGVMKKGWVTYKKKKYYFGKTTGAMLYGWQRINHKYYYFSKKSGKLTKKKR
jgi:N-acetylmuramoyl-L-alanine amidase